MGRAEHAVKETAEEHPENRVSMGHSGTFRAIVQVSTGLMDSMDGGGAAKLPPTVQLRAPYSFFSFFLNPEIALRNRL